MPHAQAKSISKQDQLPRAAKSPWVLIAAGFHRHGGMDKANLALAEYLVEHGVPVHIVCHSIDPGFSCHPLVTVRLVALPLRSFFLGGPLLEIYGRRIARKVTTRSPRAQVVVNGDNCLWPGINWMHYVHHAWKPNCKGGPLWFRVKERLSSWLSRKRELSAARIARVFITNSNRTSQDLITNLGAEPHRVHTVYLGAESDWDAVTGHERASAKESLGITKTRLVAGFVGSLGLDHRKGFDTLFVAWNRLCLDPNWDVDLVVAGNGNALPMWRTEVSRYGLNDRVRILGFTDKVRDLLAVIDVLVSPVRYESYGLNVQEAICRGIPAIVSATAGVAERYRQEFAPLLLHNPDDVGELVDKLYQWRANKESWDARFEQFGASLKTYGWRDMAHRIVEIASQADLKS